MFLEGSKMKPCKDRDCLPCNSKCPECGSTWISVTFKPVFKYENDINNHIRVNHDYSDLELECNECGGSFYYNAFDDDETLWPLVRAIQKACKISSHIDVTH